jgi:hypothetical protein
MLQRGWTASRRSLRRGAMDSQATEKYLYFFNNWATNLFAVMRAPVIVFTQEDLSESFKANLSSVFAHTGGVIVRRAVGAEDRLARVRPTPSQQTTYRAMCLYLGYEVYQVRR